MLQGSVSKAQNSKILEIIFSCYPEGYREPWQVMRIEKIINEHLLMHQQILQTNVNEKCVSNIKEILVFDFSW